MFDTKCYKMELSKTNGGFGKRLEVKVKECVLQLGVKSIQNDYLK
jgi:hypothetical protein